MQSDNRDAMELADTIIPPEIAIFPVFPSVLRRRFQPLYEFTMFYCVFNHRMLVHPFSNGVPHHRHQFTYDGVSWHLERVSSDDILERVKIGLVSIGREIHQGQIRDAFKHPPLVGLFAAYIGLLLRICVDRILQFEGNNLRLHAANPERVNAYALDFAKHLRDVWRRGLIREF